MLTELALDSNALDTNAALAAFISHAQEVGFVRTTEIDALATEFELDDDALAALRAQLEEFEVEIEDDTPELDLTPGAGGTTDMEILSVFNDGAGPLEDRLSSTLGVNPATGLRFCKDILVSSRPDGGRVAITVVDNFVDQVPEPGAVGLLAVAGFGLLARRRRRA